MCLQVMHTPQWVGYLGASMVKGWEERTSKGEKIKTLRELNINVNDNNNNSHAPAPHLYTLHVHMYKELCPSNSYCTHCSRPLTCMGSGYHKGHNAYRGSLMNRNLHYKHVQENMHMIISIYVYTGTRVCVHSAYMHMCTCMEDISA